MFRSAAGRRAPPMVRQLIAAPFRLTASVVGGVAGLVRSRLPGGSAPEVRDERPIPPRMQPEPDAPASGWDEDAPVPPGGSSPDDLLIADRVRSEVLGRVEAPTGAVNLNVENGVVFIRGQLEDQGEIEELVTLAGAVEGVVRVENLIDN